MKINRICLNILLLFFILTGIVSCDTGGVPQLTITNARFMPSQMMIGMVSAFLTITNSSGTSDSLLACAIKEYPDAHGMLHDVIDRKMVEQEVIRIPANQDTDLKPGGKHLMFSGLPETLEEEITLILNFEKSGRIEVRSVLVAH